MYNIIKQPVFLTIEQQVAFVEVNPVGNVEFFKVGQSIRFKDEANTYVFRPQSKRFIPIIEELE